MATKTNSTIDGNLGSDAEFRAHAQFIHDVLNLGWVQTADTGQIDLSTATKSGSANTASGYEIWRMDDTLQSTKPVYLKIEYGTSSLATAFSVWITLGTGTDGAGTLSGVVQTRIQVGAVSALSAAGVSYGAADDAWVTVCTNSTSAAALWFSIERTKDNTGADTGTGLILAYGSATSGHASRYLPFSGSAPDAEKGLQYVLSTNNPSTFNSDTGLGVMIPMAGVAQQPGLNVVVGMSSDFSNGALASVTLYGASHSYQRMDGVSTLRGISSSSTLQDSGVRLMLRYE